MDIQEMEHEHALPIAGNSLTLPLLISTRDASIFPTTL